MLLRTRIVLTFLLATVVFVGLVGVAALVLVRSSDRDTRAILLKDQQILWANSVQLAGAPLAERAQEALRDGTLAQAQTNDDRRQLRTLLAQVAAGGGAGPALGRVDLVGPGGGLIASTAGMGMEEPLVEASALRDLASRGTTVLGVEVDDQGKPLLVASVPSPAGGFLSVGGPFAPAVLALAQSLRAEALALGRDGTLLAATPAAEALIPRLPPVLPPNDVTGVALDDRYLDLVPSAVTDSSGDRVATVYTLRDVTVASQERLILLLGTAGLAGFLLLGVLALLYGYLQSSLLPLNDVAEAVRALSRGDTMVRVDVPRRTDEVGRIAEAVEVFRRHAVTLEQVGFRDRLERAQQEALIHREMTALAQTLEPTTRAEVLSELDRIEADARGGVGPDPEGRAGRDPAPSGGAGGVLGTAFTLMVHRVAEQQHRLADLLAERTRDLELVRQALAERTQLNRLREELEVARHLQLSSLPATFPAFPHRDEFDLFATLRPAKEVGGDFYDFALLYGDRLALMVGDASDKGVSAAMFIAMARSLIRAQVGRGGSPAECLALANETLCVDNPTMMFATALVVMVDLVSGDVTYANAGHNPPLLRRATGGVDPLDGSRGVALGVAEGVAFRDCSARLGPGDTLVLFTDGVTDSTAPDGALFGDDRLRHCLERADGQSPETLIAALMASLDGFAGEAPQMDDITLLAMTLHHRAGKEEDEGDLLEEQLPADLAALGPFADRVAAFCARQNLPTDLAHRLNLVIDEMVTNAILYGLGEGSPERVRVWLQVSAGRLRLVLEDPGPPFNPLDVPPPDLSLALEDRPIGGLGIHLMRSFASAAAYERVGGLNRLTVERILNEATSAAA